MQAVVLDEEGWGAGRMKENLTVQCHYHCICEAGHESNAAALQIQGHPPSNMSQNHPQILQNTYEGTNWCE